MKKFGLVFSFTLLVTSFCFSQSVDPEAPPQPASTTFFAELGGPGVLFSANLDHRFNNTHLGWGGRIGLGFFPDEYVETRTSTGFTYRQRSIITVPVQVNYIFGKGLSPHTFEVGAGLTVLGKKVDVFSVSDDGIGSSVLGSVSFMYRRQPKEGGFAWRIGFTPLISHGYIQPSAGVSVGYVF